MFYCVSCRLAVAISVITVVVSDNNVLNWNTDAVSVYSINKHCTVSLLFCLVFVFFNLDPETAQLVQQHSSHSKRLWIRTILYYA